MADPPTVEMSIQTSNSSEIVKTPVTLQDTSNTKLLANILRSNNDSVDKLVSRVHRVIRSREGLDITLLFAAETARLLGAVLEILSNAPSLKSTRILAVLASVLPKSIRKILSSVSSARLVSAACEASTRLQILVLILEEWQILTRLWGLLDIWMSTKETSEEPAEDGGESSPPTRLDTAIVAMSRLSLVSFHFCEATAWLSSKNVLKWSPEAQDNLLLWAARSWGAFTCVEMSRMLVEWLRKRNDNENSDDIEWRKQWRKDFLQNLAWLPLAIHWSKLPEPWLPEVVVAIFGLYPAMGYMKAIWEDAA